MISLFAPPGSPDRLPDRAAARDPGHFKEPSMKRSLTVIALVFAGLTAASSARGAEGWKLVWSDEFDKPGLPDPAKWGYETGFIRNDEKQFYTAERKENARIEDGKLIIEARKERWKNPSFAPEADKADKADKARKRGRRGPEFADYTSASLTTSGKASWTHGRIEVRAKLPAGRGTWPAIWTLGTNIRQAGWPTCGEIDIMEFVGFEPGVVHANVHTRKYNHAQNTGKGDKVSIPDASEAFHVYALEWDADRLDFFVDEKKYFTCQNEKSGPEAWPFDKDQYLILNLAIGGAWGGQKGIDDAIFPQRYTIDYVRVYEKEKAGGSAAPVTPSPAAEGSKK
jgi:beta-glucanase (GH16 family)